MRIIVIGGTGLIGSKLVHRLEQDGHDAVAASPAQGVNSLTGDGLAEAMSGAEVLVDVSNSPSFEDQAVLDFFTTASQNLLEAAREAGVRHYVALSVVGCDRLPESGYLRAKVAQEQLIEKSGLDHSIVRATQFYEFVDRIAQSATVDGEVRLPPVQFAPIAADDVAALLAEVVEGGPAGGVLEVGGPATARFDEFVALSLSAAGDSRTVVTDPHAHYFGAELAERSLVPDEGARTGSIGYDDWLRASR